MSRRTIFAIFLLLLALGLAGLVLTDVWPGLRGPAPETSEWYWPHVVRPLERWWPAVLTGLALVGFTVWWLPRATSRDGLPLIVLVLLGLMLTMSIIYADRLQIGAELVDRTLSKASNGYLATAGEINNLDAALRQFPELMPTFDNDHAQTHPPGLIIAHWLTDHGLRRWPGLASVLAEPATLWRCTDLWLLARPPATAASLLLWSWIPVVMAALTPIPAFALSRRWYSRPAARLAAVLVATLPSILVFSPTPDQMFAFLAMLSLYWLASGLADRRWPTVLGAGLVASLMTFLSLGNFVWLALLGGYALLWLIWPANGAAAAHPPWRNKTNWVLLVLFGVGGLSLWLIYWLGWGVAPWLVAQVGLQQHYELVTRLRRYDWWFVYNLVDFFLFAGPPIVLGFLIRFGRSIRTLRRGLAEDGRLAILLALLLLAIHLAGSTRGEVGRLWLVFFPLAAVLAAGFWLPGARDRLTPVLIILAQLILALSIGLGWRPFYAVILPVEKPVLPLAGVPSLVRDDIFSTGDGSSIRLLGFDPPAETRAAGDPVRLELYWQSDSPTLEPYTVFVHLVGADGQVAVQSDSWPVNGRWPTTCWDNGEVIVDQIQLALPVDIEPGNYQLLVGLYDAATNLRLLTTGENDAVLLSEIKVD